MRKKSRPSEIITDTKVLKDINYINEIESLILNKRGESGKSKKTPNEKYFILDIYKNQNVPKTSKNKVFECLRGCLEFECQEICCGLEVYVESIVSRGPALTNIGKLGLNYSQTEKDLAPKVEPKMVQSNFLG